MTQQLETPYRKEFAGRTVLVVGGAGFVGSNLVRSLVASKAARILVVDNLLSSQADNLPDDPSVELTTGSINDDRILDSLTDSIDYAFHLATYHGNQSSIADPLADHEHNTLTSLKLFERLKDLELIKVVYAGAGCTVAEKTYDQVDATHEDAPVSLYLDSPYQISKIIGELYGNYYFARHDLPIVKARFQNVYGAGEVLGAGRWRGTPHTVWRNVVPSFVYRGLKQMPLTVENEGRATRDFIHVTDIVRGLMACAADGQAGEVYNLASGAEVSIAQLAELVNAQTANPTPIQYLPARDWDRSGKRHGSTEKSQKMLGLTCQVPFESGLQDTIEWTRINLPRIDACISQHASQMDLSGLKIPAGV